MDLKKLIYVVENSIGRRISRKEIGQILNISESGVSQRLSRGTKVSREEISLVENYYSLKVEADSDFFEIHYYETDKVNIKNPKIKSLIMDREWVDQLWDVNKNSLRLIAMPNDKMHGNPHSQHCIRNKDVLLLDTSSNDITRSGIYAYETLDGTKLQISYVSVMINNNVRFYYSNELYPDEVRTPQDLINLKFKVVGRVIKNLSYVFV